MLDRGYSERMVRKEILRARAIPRDTLLGKVNNQKNNNKITFNITYQPVFSNVKKILEEMHVILAPDDRHKEVFPDVPLIGFKNNKSLSDHLMYFHYCYYYYRYFYYHLYHYCYLYNYYYYYYCCCHYYYGYYYEIVFIY